MQLQFAFPDVQNEIEDPGFLTRQLVTCIGNKRSRLKDIGSAVKHAKRRLGKDRLRTFDVFSGSGVVSRFLKAHSSFHVANDIEDYASVVARCYLSNRSQIDYQNLEQIVNEMNVQVRGTSPFATTGFVRELYSPKDDDNITQEDRVFYTNENARRLDDYRRLIDSAPSEYRDLLLGPLLGKASVHANTAGVFKGFYKDGKTGVGKFGGSGSDALLRILGQIVMEAPILSRFECEHSVTQVDANRAARETKGFDLAYLDPPYNQHPYGSNYFMLNLLVSYNRPEKLSRVSGIPTNWKRSGYYVKSKSLPLMEDLVSEIDARFVIVSFNNEGFIKPDEMRRMLQRHGKLEVFETPYNAYRGSRNFNNRSVHVLEQLFLLEKS
ncbi:MAG: DNA adenine methylase [Gammaproteobacteria bacterium]|nr:DNA adenine methylase [Gammaproteobacteria bacterium]